LSREIKINIQRWRVREVVSDIYKYVYAGAINSLLRLISPYRKAIIEPLSRAVSENGAHRRYRGTLCGDRVGVRLPFRLNIKKEKVKKKKKKSQRRRNSSFAACDLNSIKV